MELVFTIKEIMERGLWIDICNIKGWNEWCVKEGLAGMEEQVKLNKGESINLGLIKEERYF
jgi:hypothetical protein